MTPFDLLTISLILCSLSQAASEVEYISITTDSSVPCSEPPCLTLSQFAANSSHYTDSNTTLIIFSGIHYLSEDLSLSYSVNFVMKSETDSTVQIECTDNSRISFSQSQYIHITNLEFIGCGGNQVKQVQEFVVNNTKFDGQDVSGTALQMIETTAQIINSTFVSNSKGILRECEMYEIRQIDLVHCDPAGRIIPIGGAIISTNSTVNISHSKFQDNEAFIGGAILAEQDSVINLSETVFIDNNATVGGVLHSFSSTIIINASTFHNNTCSRDSDSLRYAGGIIFIHNSYIIIQESYFLGNTAEYGVGVMESYHSNVKIRGSYFYHNSGRYGGVLHSGKDTITVEECNFYNNSGARLPHILKEEFSLHHQALSQ